jgi:hypothetical protein
VSWNGPVPVQGAFEAAEIVAPEGSDAAGRLNVSSHVCASVPVRVIVRAWPAVAVVVTFCAAGAVFPPVTPAGRSAMSWPTLAAAAAAVAILSPVAPAEPSTASATSVRILAAETTSPRSVMPVGGEIAASALMPNAPTIMAPSEAETTDGAVMLAVVPVLALNVSTGVVVFTPA